MCIVSLSCMWQYIVKRLLEKLYALRNIATDLCTELFYLMAVMVKGIVNNIYYSFSSNGMVMGIVMVKGIVNNIFTIPFLQMALGTLNLQKYLCSCVGMKTLLLKGIMNFAHSFVHGYVSFFLLPQVESVHFTITVHFGTIHC